MAIHLFRCCVCEKLIKYGQFHYLNTAWIDDNNGSDASQGAFNKKVEKNTDAARCLYFHQACFEEAAGDFYVKKFRGALTEFSDLEKKQVNDPDLIVADRPRTRPWFC